MQLITQQVLAALAGAGASHGQRAEIHPPIGVCTGDYSKFPELKDKHIGAAQPAAAPAPAPIAAPVPVVDAGPVFSGVIVAKQIDKIRGTLRLAENARLTPAAQDLVRERKLKIERVAGGASAVSASAAPGTPSAKPQAASKSEYVWWIAGSCPVVDKVMPVFRTEMSPLAHIRQPSALVGVVREMAKRIGSGRAAGGVIFVPTAATAACFANRCANLRAVVGTCTGAVEEGIRQMGANVLIVEYPQHGWQAIHEMLDRFVKEARPALPEIERQLQELGTCA